MDDGTNKKNFEDFSMICESGGSYADTEDFKHITNKIPGKLGLYKIGTERDAEMFSFPIYLKDTDFNNRRSRLNELKEFLFTDLGEPKKIKIYFLDEPDKYFNVEVSGQINVRKLMSGSRFNLDFIAFDPQKYSIVNASEVTWGSTDLTFESTSYTYGHEGTKERWFIKSPQDIDVYVTGLALQPTITIWGTATDLVITANGKKIRVGSFTSKSWVIDTERYIAYVGGAENIIAMDKFMLRRGNNKIKFEGTNLDLDVSIKFRDRWK